MHQSLSSRCLSILMVWLIVGVPLWAERPPAGYARPPIHVKGNATTAPTGYVPTQLRHAYQFDSAVTYPATTSWDSNQPGSGQTIAIIDAYDDPTIESDLATFDSQFGLPACTSLASGGNGCFEKATPLPQGLPKVNAGWALEISLDVEWAHAIAPGAKILLVEAASNSFADLLAAVDYAVSRNASVVSMSWGGGESSGETSNDFHFLASGITFTASSGDSGNGVEYPAASPNVVAVGGTTLPLDSTGNLTGSETAWSGSGGGQSAYETRPSYQSSVQSSGKRGVPDVSYDANPNTGVSVYDSTRYQGQKGWFKVGGTSAGAPQWAAAIALADQQRASAGKALLTDSHAALYGNVVYGTTLRDITSGSNGSCGAVCTATIGYDFVTGLGSPLAKGLFTALTSY